MNIHTNWTSLSEEEINEIEHYIQMTIYDDIEECIEFLEILKSGKLKGKQIDIEAIENYEILIEAFEAVSRRKTINSKFDKKIETIKFEKFKKMIVKGKFPKTNCIIEIKSYEELVEILKFINENYERIKELDSTKVSFRLYPDIGTGNLTENLMIQKTEVEGVSTKREYDDFKKLIAKDIPPMNLDEMTTLSETLEIFKSSIPENATNIDKINFIGEVLLQYYNNENVDINTLIKRTSIINFIQGKGICIDIAGLLCTCLEIPCMVVSVASKQGNSSGHAWNKVKVDNKKHGWLNLDFSNFLETLEEGVHLQTDEKFLSSSLYNKYFIELICVDDFLKNKSICGVNQEELKQSLGNIHKWGKKKKINNFRGTPIKNNIHTQKWRRSIDAVIHQDEFTEFAKTMPMSMDLYTMFDIFTKMVLHNENNLNK